MIRTGFAALLANIPPDTLLSMSGDQLASLLSQLDPAQLAGLLAELYSRLGSTAG